VGGRSTMITTGFLADHPETIPTLVQWFRGQWTDYFSDQSDAEMVQDFRSEASRDRIPIRLVAFKSGVLAGTIVLRQQAADFSPGYQPGLGGLFVVATHRRRGIGTALVRAGMGLAAGLGYGTLYATTIKAAEILEDLGWERIQTVQHEGENHGLYRCEL
jgi:GNAT superfamily N-acetyltransferase